MHFSTKSWEWAVHHCHVLAYSTYLLHTDFFQTPRPDLFLRASCRRSLDMGYPIRVPFRISFLLFCGNWSQDILLHSLNCKAVSKTMQDCKVTEIIFTLQGQTGVLTDVFCHVCGSTTLPRVQSLACWIRFPHDENIKKKRMGITSNFFFPWVPDWGEKKKKKVWWFRKKWQNVGA